MNNKQDKTVLAKKIGYKGKIENIYLTDEQIKFTKEYLKGINLLTTPIADIPDNYDPLDEKDIFMNLNQLEYFRRILVEEYKQKSLYNNSLLEDLQKNTGEVTDLEEKTNNEARFGELINAGSSQKYLHKIIETLQNMSNGIYGFDIEDEHAIPIKRLKIVPTADLSVENKEKINRDFRSIINNKNSSNETRNPR